MKFSKNLILAYVFVARATWPQSHDLVAVLARPVSRTVELPGEFQPFLSVSVHAKVRGYVQRILVDRGSAVNQGQLLAELTAPEMKAQIAEAESKLHEAESERLQAEAQLAAAQSTAEWLAKASETPGAIAGSEIVQAEKQVEAAKAFVQSKHQAIRASEAMLRAQKDLESYLSITAPFDGGVTERLVHPGALVGPATDPVLLVIQQTARLRLVVSVPEEYVGGLCPGRASSSAYRRFRNELTQEVRHVLPMHSTPRRALWRWSWT